jgi:hypothetical protein
VNEVTAMPQVTIHIPDELKHADDGKKNLAIEILSKHGLSFSPMHLNTSAPSLQPFNMVVVPDLQKAKDIVAELQSNGISAFLKPQVSAP